MNDLVTIRQEEERDFDAIRNVVKAAFAGAEHTDGDEHNLVDRLRITDEYIPELSLVARSRWNDCRTHNVLTNIHWKCLRFGDGSSGGNSIFSK